MNSNTPAKNRIGTSAGLLLTSIEIIDVQHLYVTELFQNLLELKTTNVEFEVVSNKLDELAEYMNFHFNTEENLMRCAGVDGLEQHIQHHDLFRNKFDEFRKLIKTQNQFLKKLNFELLLTFLRNWFVAHTRKFDLLYIVSVQQYLSTNELNEVIHND